MGKPMSKTVARYQIEYDYDGGNLYYAQGGKMVPNEVEPSELVSSADYDSLSKDYTEAVEAVRWLKSSLLKVLDRKPVMNLDEALAMAETVLNKA